MVKLSDHIERLRVITALRIALVMVVCIILAVLLEMRSGVFAIFPVLVISLMFHDESPLAGLSLIGGAAVGAVASTITIDLFLTARPVFLLVTLIVICLLGYWAAQGFRKRWPGAFGAFVAILIVAGAAFSAISEADLGERVAFHWTLEITLGVVVTWVIMLGLWPSPSARDLDNLCAGIGQECAILLDRTADRLQAGLDLLRPERGQHAGARNDQPAETRQIKAELAKAELNLTNTTVLAPDDGIVDNMQLHAGAYAQSGKAVMTLVDSSRWWIVANYEENALSVIQEGQAVEFGLYMFPGQLFSGRVEASVGELKGGRVLRRAACRRSTTLPGGLPSRNDFRCELRLPAPSPASRSGLAPRRGSSSLPMMGG